MRGRHPSPAAILQVLLSSICHIYMEHNTATNRGQRRSESKIHMDLGWGFVFMSPPTPSLSPNSSLSSLSSRQRPGEHAACCTAPNAGVQLTDETTAPTRLTPWLGSTRGQARPAWTCLRGRVSGDVSPGTCLRGRAPRRFDHKAASGASAQQASKSLRRGFNVKVSCDLELASRGSYLSDSPHNVLLYTHAGPQTVGISGWLFSTRTPSGSSVAAVGLVGMIEGRYRELEMIPKKEKKREKNGSKSTQKTKGEKKREGKGKVCCAAEGPTGRNVCSAAKHGGGEQQQIGAGISAREGKVWREELEELEEGGSSAPKVRALGSDRARARARARPSRCEGAGLCGPQRGQRGPHTWMNPPTGTVSSFYRRVCPCATGLF